MRGRRQGQVAPTDRIHEATVRWSFDHLSRTEGRLVGTITSRGVTVTGHATVIKRFLVEAINPEVIWKELTYRVATQIRLNVARLRE